MQHHNLQSRTGKKRKQEKGWKELMVHGRPKAMNVGVTLPFGEQEWKMKKRNWLNNPLVRGVMVTMEINELIETSVWSLETWNEWVDVRRSCV